MGTSLSPARQDMERYRRFRALSMELNHSSIPRQAYDEIGDALGIRRKGILIFDSEDMDSVKMDLCPYHWDEKGKNLNQRNAETPPQPQERTEASFCRHAPMRNTGSWWRSR